jgi:hypothetical protein
MTLISRRVFRALGKGAKIEDGPHAVEVREFRCDSGAVRVLYVNDLPVE